MVPDRFPGGSRPAKVLRYFRAPAQLPRAESRVVGVAHAVWPEKVLCVLTERCFYIELNAPLSKEEEEMLSWLIGETFERSLTRPVHSFLDNFRNQDTYLWKYDQSTRKPWLSHLPAETSLVVEAGPRLSFSTPFSTNVTSICSRLLLHQVTRVEESTRYKIFFSGLLDHVKSQASLFFDGLHDRMTHCFYDHPLDHFPHVNNGDGSFQYVPLLSGGRDVLVEWNVKHGWGFDDVDIEAYVHLFRDHLKRNPTNVECYDLAQGFSIIYTTN